MHGDDGILTEAEKHWWIDDEESEPHNGIANVLMTLQTDTDRRHQKFRRYLHIYLNKNVTGWGPGSETDDNEDGLWGETPSGEPWSYINPIRSCIETLASRYGAHKIKPKFLTDTTSSDAASLRKQAQLIEKAVMGEWSAGQVYKNAVSVFYDAAILGLGAMAVYSEDGKVVYERVFPGELVVDETACRTTPPRTLYQVRAAPADTIVARWPDKEEEIKAAVGQFPIGEEEPGYMKVTDMVQVIEAWHLPSKTGADDGLHAVVIDGCTLQTTPWKRDHFPFAFMRWGEPVLGFWPQGLVECEEPLQYMVNKTERRFQSMIHMYCVNRTFIQKGTVDVGKIRNNTGDIIEYKGNVPPRTDSPLSIPADAFRYQEQRYERVFEESGVSMLSAASVKPKGVEAAVALRELSEVETGRHALLGTEWEDFFMSLARLTVEERKEIGGRSRYRDSEEGVYLQIDWKAALKDLDFELEVFPTSYLPHTPSGRLSTVMEMLGAGFFGPPDSQQSIGKAMQILNFPDLSQLVSIETAALEDIDFQVELMLDGKPQEPEPFQDLQLALARVTSALLRARSDGVPEDRQGLLLDYLDAVQDLLEPPAPPAPAPMGPPPEEMMIPPEGVPEVAELPPGELIEGTLPPEPLPPEAPMVLEE